MLENDASAAGRAPSATHRRVRTRFAPSPTGMLHLGALRTALFSWLLARHYQGDFILRIEDTDQNRIIPGALESIIESLRGMGIMYDEGPDKASVAALAPSYGAVPPSILPDFGGSYGPYFQSQRLPRYREILEILLDSGHAYYAFETKEELDAERAVADARKLPYRYSRRYRDVDLGKARDRVAGGEPHVIRFKMPLSGIIATTDALRGVIEWQADTQDDFVILKGDGYPPYHLAAMVDDHDMAISHVLRGDDWLSSFPKHVALLEALGWEPPIFVHTPNVLGPDGGKKLSKRDGAQGVHEYLEEGFLREALVNFLALVGWSPGDDSEIMSEAEIISRFDVPGISVSPARFDVKKLTSINGIYLRDLKRNSPQELADRALPFLIKAGLIANPPTPEARKYATDVLLVEPPEHRLDEAPSLIDFFFQDLPVYDENAVAKWLRPEGAADYLATVRAALWDLSDWDAANIEKTVRSVGAALGREKGDITHPLRVAVSGRKDGPGLFEMLAVLGKERVVHRLERALELSRG